MKRNMLAPLIAICVILLGLSVGSFFFTPDRAFSENENRYLQTTPELTADSVLSGRFMTEVENYTSDQILLRDLWTGARSTLQRAEGRQDISGTYLLRALSRPVVVGVVVGILHPRQRRAGVGERPAQLVRQQGKRLALVVVGGVFRQVFAQHPGGAGRDQRRAAFAAVGGEELLHRRQVLFIVAPVEGIVSDLGEVAPVRAQIGAADVLFSLGTLQHRPPRSPEIAEDDLIAGVVLHVLHEGAGYDGVPAEFGRQLQKLHGADRAQPGGRTAGQAAEGRALLR